MNYKNCCWLWPKEIVKKGLVFPMLKCCFFQSFLVSPVGRLFYGGFLILTEQMWFLTLFLRFLRGESWSVSCILISCIFFFCQSLTFLWPLLKCEVLYCSLIYNHLRKVLVLLFSPKCLDLNNLSTWEISFISQRNKVERGEQGMNHDQTKVNFTVQGERYNFHKVPSD